MEDLQTVTEIAMPALDLSDSLGQSSRFADDIESAYLASALTLPHLHYIQDDGRTLLQAVSSREAMTGEWAGPGPPSSARRARKRTKT
jgi:hypothetical protein